MDKNILETKFDNGEWGKMTQDEKFVSETFYGIHVGKNGPFNPQIHGSTLPLTMQHQKMKFPNRVKEETK